jgi:hypothetical protein
VAVDKKVVTLTIGTIISMENPILREDVVGLKIGHKVTWIILITLNPHTLDLVNEKVMITYCQKTDRGKKIKRKVISKTCRLLVRNLMSN